VVKSVDAGQILFKSLTDNKPVDIEQAPEPTPAAPTVAAKPKLPRYEQVIQQGGRLVRVIWVEVAPNNWKRFDTLKAADDYKPESETPKSSDPKTESPKSDSGE
jgi:hypothetical protein